MSDYKFPGYPETDSLLAKWATDAAYDAGSDAWSGQPIKSTPVQSYREAGHIPDGIPKAEYENWWKNQVAQFIALTHALKWTEFQIFAADINGDPLALGAGECACALFLTGSVWFFPNDTADQFYQARANHPPVLSAPGSMTSDVSLRTFAGNPTTETLIAAGICNTPGTFCGLYRSTDRGTTWSGIALEKGSTDYLEAYRVQYNTVTDLGNGAGIFAAIGTTLTGGSYFPHLWISEDDGATWDTADAWALGASSATKTTAQPTALLMLPEDIWVLTNSATDCQLWHTFTPGGSTQSSDQLGFRVRAAAHDPYTDTILLIGDDGKVYTGTPDDPTDWTHISTISVGDFDTLSIDNEAPGERRSCHLTTLGGAWLLKLKSPNFVLASFDAGVSWEIYPGNLDSSSCFVDGSGVEQRIATFGVDLGLVAFGTHGALLRIAASATP